MSGGAPEAWVPTVQTRSRSLLLAIGFVIVVETVALHLWLHARHPALAWTLTALSVLTLAWLVLDYRALASAGLRLGAAGCHLRIGSRVRGEVPWAALEQVGMPGWRDLPDAGRQYLNAARPEDPNLLFVFRAPHVLRTALGRQPVRHLGLRVEQPERVVECWQQWGRQEAATISGPGSPPPPGMAISEQRSSTPP